MHTFIPAYLTSLFTRKPLIIWVVDILRKPQDELSLVKLLVNRVRSGSPVILALRFVFLHLLRRMAVKNAGACFVGGGTTAHYVRRYLSAKNVHLTRSGIDELWFDPPAQPILFEGAYLGRIDFQKGLDVLLKAWQRVLRKKENAKLIIIGSGNEKSEHRLRDEISSLELSRNVNLAGYLEGRELVTKLSSARIFIFPSKSEGKPIAVDEAMAAGLPCVISDIPALREVYSQSAILVSPDDPQSWGEEILKLLDRPELMKGLSVKGKELVSDQTWDKVAIHEYNIIKSFLKNPT